MRHKGLRVRIIGAGTGGLCLAQGLKQDDVEVEVFERDHTPTDRLQGYRLSINGTGRRALKACLPQGLFAKLIANSAKPSESVTFLDHRLNRLLAIDLQHRDAEEADSELPVSRIALRGISAKGSTILFITVRGLLLSRTIRKATLTPASRMDRQRPVTC